jgi:hypothetical protein
MEGVTTAIVLFVLVCVVYPHIVKHKAQFYAAFAALLVIILLHSLNIMIGRGAEGSAGFQVFAGALTGLLQLIAILLLFMSCGGVSLRDIAGEMANVVEVLRRGEEEKTYIVPLSGEMPKPRKQPAPGASTPLSTDTPSAEQINLPPDAGWPAKPPESPPDSSIPLE